jgi:hypothetical protein
MDKKRLPFTAFIFQRFPKKAYAFSRIAKLHVAILEKGS